jgi:dUTP pyrophosphatase
VNVLIKRLNKEVSLPDFATIGAGAVDLESTISFSLKPGQIEIVPTGLAMAIESGYAGMIIPRSGKGTQGMVLGNLTGLIDSDYRGEIGVCLWNRSVHATFQVAKGERIAQMIFVPVMHPDFMEVDALPETVRGIGGFGSTGG